MIVTTTPTIEGHRISRYVGIVTGEAIIGANVVSDFFARVRDIVGGRAGAYESKLADARTGGEGRVASVLDCRPIRNDQ